MPATAVTNSDLRRSDGFRVESPDGLIGWVEEVWLGPRDEPQALAVKRVDGRRGLLSAGDVAAVATDEHWVVVAGRPELLELDAPRLAVIDSDPHARVAASWSTTGAALPAPPPTDDVFRRVAHVIGARPRSKRRSERPLWQAVAFLLSGIFLMVVVTITLAFAVAYFVTGQAY